MTAVLRVFIFFGLIVWAFFLAERYMPEVAPSISAYFKDPNKSARCAQYGSEAEGERVLSYNDRVKQVVNGCW